ncbi:hypothetical protein DM02DRAFT_158964 [Periconia macrospinosa]|uniref:Heterokaryon incompatibility domain-containing protein n=1 Tax=Periconia macrospinosa TaxID=97972 RepID=A0A2V1E5P6_9PLEO|nr:hypothetical protein DM02DRAFT_158964 [Periconia macrospinosa]
MGRFGASFGRNTGLGCAQSNSAESPAAILHTKKKNFLPPSIPIWVDAACNQSDDGETNAQVANMTKIYSKSTKTLIFLGPGSRGSDEIMTSLDNIGRRAVEHGVFDLVVWEEKFVANFVVEHISGDEERTTSVSTYQVLESHSEKNHKPRE